MFHPRETGGFGIHDRDRRLKNFGCEEKKDDDRNQSAEGRRMTRGRVTGSACQLNASHMCIFPFLETTMGKTIKSGGFV